MYLDTSEEAIAQLNSNELNTLMEKCFAWAEYYSRINKNREQYLTMQAKITRIQARLFPNRPILEKK